ncbi:RNA polymerase ECF-subfamily sigma factor [[Actinomadura] parvosata subsp. kistnae]|uniref:RNA polymerase sigma factor n=1 Tax=[Actinomadura] parvosata TaxID=1955412 RepID=UPI000D2A1F74|nr:RNA polymerase ECF-subfamily sigma factor [Actinomadura parvosata subsp. kistnae]
MIQVTPQVTDAALIERSLTQPDCFAALFDRHYPAIHGYAERRLSRPLADDIAAETFLVAFDRRGTYDRSRPDARPWLYGIASNLIARHRRAEVRQYQALARAEVSEVGEDHAERVVDSLDAFAVRGRLSAALAGLPAGDRDVLLLVAWAELTSDEVGRALGVPAGTVRSRLHRARTKIRAVLDPALTEKGR